MAKTASKSESKSESRSKAKLKFKPESAKKFIRQLSKRASADRSALLVGALLGSIATYLVAPTIGRLLTRTLSLGEANMATGAGEPVHGSSPYDLDLPAAP